MMDETSNIREPLDPYRGLFEASQKLRREMEEARLEARRLLGETRKEELSSRQEQLRQVRQLQQTESARFMKPRQRQLGGQSRTTRASRLRTQAPSGGSQQSSPTNSIMTTTSSLEMRSTNRLAANMTSHSFLPNESKSLSTRYPPNVNNKSKRIMSTPLNPSSNK